MNPIDIIRKYYDPESLAFKIIVPHSQAVSEMAIGLASRLGMTQGDIRFISEASILHDIGMIFTYAPKIGCHGDKPYICHGFLGHDLLLSEGLPKHALVCERHTGTGLTLREIDHLDAGLPRRPLAPVSLPEKIICYCDKFFSKDPDRLTSMKTYAAAVKSISRYGPEKVSIFEEWHQQFNQ